jgi:putative sigma-54 modulation protein
MNINITFRHLEATDSIKAYATEKIAKLQKFLKQPMTVKVTLSLEKLAHGAEVRISAGSEHHEAHETSEDMYASIDKVIDKLERQIQASKDLSNSRRRRGESLREVLVEEESKG